MKKSFFILFSKRGHHEIIAGFVIFTVALFIMAQIKRSHHSTPPSSDRSGINTSVEGYPILDPPAQMKDQFGHTAQYYSDQMYAASQAGLYKEADIYRANMKYLYTFDLTNFEKIHKKSSK